jgi:hypothetical protein
MTRVARILLTAAFAALAVFAQDFSSITVESVAEGFRFTEGPRVVEGRIFGF